MIGSSIHQYKILEKLGSGGQGTVYKALDTRLNRTVVVKILPAELTSKTANFKRFQREAQLCSQLDHPNICTIYEFGEYEGVYYIAMQYIEGKNVRQLVAGKPLELKSALSIAIQVCDALAYTHSKGIIHRDIKAGNVMVTSSGRVKILDFGLAKLIYDEDKYGVDRTELTEIGIPYGTATYAAPEQARGERADHRADIFSTGVLLYEMLTGIWAFQGKTVVDVRHQVLYGTPKPIAEMRSDPVPADLQRIIDKALAKDPKDRYQKIADMRDDLKRVYFEVTGETLFSFDQGITPKHAKNMGFVKRIFNWLTGGTTVESSSQKTPAQVPDSSVTTAVTSTGIEKKSIAILPFKNLGNDNSFDFYEFSLADAVITELARLKSLIVRPSSVIAKYQAVSIDPRDAGRELGVDAVLSAGFICSGNRIRVTAQLLDVDTGEILWSDRIDAEGDDILTLQDVISRQILEGLQLELSPKELEKIGHAPTQNPQAYEEYLRGRDLFGKFIFHSLSNEDCEAAIHHFKKAIELDSHFALAYSGLGACYANRVFKGLGSAEDYTYAEAAFSKAIIYDPNVVEARVLMVLIYLSRGEKKKAQAEIKLLTEQFPNEAPLYFVKGTIHRLNGEYAEALKSWDKLSKLDPAARVISSYNKARIYVYKGEYEKALQELEKGEKLEPSHPLIRVFKGAVLYYQGKEKEGLQIIEDVLNKNPQMEGLRPLYAIFLANSGRADEARAQFTEKVRSLAKADHDIAYWMASANAQLGEKDEAFKWLERAIKLGNENKPWFLSDKMLAPLREDPRFDDLMRKIEH
ncbi:MAG: protein kinase [Pyrinomonadaceae bacterium]|nr:protein kinase [Pyrinomonadaceae bacterium]MCX7639893.1 protein kinase [Pyrinomonadaceae bacterium]MDW8304065.1 protein kinase [Acidobacteriota bacterium]